MEELTIEQKAKAYDEALERAKELLEVGLKDTRDKRVVLSFFPELAESEDEKIRKGLIDYFSDFHLQTFAGLDPKKILSWLEKQGRQKPANTDFSDLRTWKYIVDAAWTEKEGIGQYLDSPFIEEVAKKLQKRFGNIEQKPTKWSEKDEKSVHLACEFIRHHSTSMDSIGGIDCSILIERLKSLEDRYAFKPSDEQLKALKEAVDEHFDIDGGALWHLYEDLKKL